MSQPKVDKRWYIVRDGSGVMNIVPFCHYYPAVGAVLAKDRDENTALRGVCLVLGAFDESVFPMLESAEDLGTQSPIGRLVSAGIWAGSIAEKVDGLQRA